jgi:SAM-dependent methyltransferase
MSGAAELDSYASIADLYDGVVPYANRPDVAFFVEAAVASGGPVLELGCGTGRVLLPIARADVEAVGLDSSASMLAVCRARLDLEEAAVRSRVQLVEADMREFDLPRRFALITIPFRPFQHLTSVDDQVSCLRSIHRHLADDGRLVLDLFNPSLEGLLDQREGEERDEEPEFATADGRRVRRRHKIVSHDRFNQTLQVELIYYVTHPDGREERLVQAFPMRYLFRFEAEHLLARCGFEVEHLYASYDRRAYGSTYPGELIFVARHASTVRAPGIQEPKE